jgi:hypothetical protein
MNQHQITMTAGDDRTFTFTVDDDYDGDTATLVVDGQFEKTAEVGEDDGSGSSVVSFTIDSADTSDRGDYAPRSHSYSIKVDHDGDTLTIVRGLLVITDQLAV